jgi:hypothetical protein
LQDLGEAYATAYVGHGSGSRKVGKRDKRWHGEEEELMTEGEVEPTRVSLGMGVAG